MTMNDDDDDDDGGGGRRRRGRGGGGGGGGGINANAPVSIDEKPSESHDARCY